jgi:hypothetical protein
MVTFGLNDLVIVDNCRTDFSYSNLGGNFEIPEGGDGETYLAGKERFKVFSMEVWKMEKIE